MISKIRSAGSNPAKDTNWFDIKDAPFDGTRILGRALNPMPSGKYIEIPVRWTKTFEASKNSWIWSWTADDGRYCFCIGSWQHIKE